jgi:hypothetical protein
MLDGNDDMRRGPIHSAFINCQLRECILTKHGNKAVNTYRRNTKNIPIDGIWISPSLEIRAGGYLGFDEVFPGTDHRTLWVDISYEYAFGHHMDPITKPQARRLQCKDPRLVKNFNRHYEKYLTKHNLLERAIELEKASSCPLSPKLQQEYIALDKLRYEGMAEAERKCRKLRMGQVGFSPTIQLAMRQIRAWSLLLKKKKGMKISSRLLQRSLKKAGIDSQNRAMEIVYLEEQLLQAHRYYYAVKGTHGELRSSALDSLAEAIAQVPPW